MLRSQEEVNVILIQHTIEEGEPWESTNDARNVRYIQREKVQSCLK